MLIGLCGRSGSGKGYIANLFAARGIPSVDTDQVYRAMTGRAEVLSPCMQELVERFGNEILAADNSLNRAAMRTLVFAGDAPEREGTCRKNLADLNKITHRHILARTEEVAAELLQKGAPFVLIDAPVLYESGFDKHCAAVLCVTAPEEVRIGRIMRRDGITREAAQARLKSQMDGEELLRRADYVIENDGDKETLYVRVDNVIERILKSRETREI